MRATVLGLVVMTGCVGAPPAGQLEVSARPTVVEQCTELRAAQLGTLPLVVELGSTRITFQEWTLADAEATSAVGFAASVPVGVTFHVRAGADVFSGRGDRWLHPRGVAGPRVHGIEGITFCRLAPGAEAVAIATR